MEQIVNCEVKNEIADPSTVGLTGFAIALFCLSFFNAGILGPDSMSLIIPLALICGGPVHFVAAWWGFRKNELFTALVFATYGSFWLVFSIAQFGVLMNWFVINNDILLVFLLAYTIFALYAFLGSFSINTAVIIVLGTLFLVFVLLDLGLIINPLFTKLGGYVGVFTSLAAFYTAATNLLNTLNKAKVQPVGTSKAG